jgi:hypothetical protein
LCSSYRSAHVFFLILLVEDDADAPVAELLLGLFAEAVLAAGA